jgi:hypothetical protein
LSDIISKIFCLSYFYLNALASHCFI